MKFGRRQRTFHGLVPHLSVIRRRLRLRAPKAPAPDADYTVGMPANLGEMLNTTLSDCTAAGLYHRRQVVTFNTNPPMDTQPDSVVERFYSLSCGYDPANRDATDQGGIEQDVLTYAVQHGIPLADGTVDKLSGFIEIDPHNAIDVDWAINDCLGVYIGFDVPAYLEQTLTAAGSVWDVDPSADNTIVGGHCVYVAAHRQRRRLAISWGATYDITDEFWLERVDECYALLGDDLMSSKTGKTILGMTVDQIRDAIG